MFDLYDELRKVIAALDEHQVDYALCGGLAMAIYGRPRATVDINILILAESLDVVIPIATKLGYEVRGLDMTFSQGAIEIRRLSKIDRIGGQVLSLDLLLVTPAIQHVWNSRIEAGWEDGTLSVVSIAGLIELKKLRHSLQDLADI
ncbi:MAG: hypothetical protein M3447_03610, partial [Acidobacteriota bacterium]|nr:hypothetical protein [Acidobacteriota bacterium]